jgi:hypothetical protein
MWPQAEVRVDVKVLYEVKELVMGGLDRVRAGRKRSLLDTGGGAGGLEGADAP